MLYRVDYALAVMFAGFIVGALFGGQTANVPYVYTPISCDDLTSIRLQPSEVGLRLDRVGDSFWQNKTVKQQL